MTFANIERLTTIMARLRDPKTGCEWDTVQTFETIAPYTIEEAYEVADAIERGDMAELKDELGDLLLQVDLPQPHGRGGRPFRASRRDRRDQREDGAPPPAHLPRPGRGRPPFLGTDQGGRARRARAHESALDGVAARPPRPAPRRKAPEARCAHRLRLARPERRPRQDRRGTGRGRGGGDPGRDRGGESATCCSRSSTGPANKASTPRPRCAAPTPNSRSRFKAMESRSRRRVRNRSIWRAKEALWQKVKASAAE
jgi:hypothetical protein